MKNALPDLRNSLQKKSLLPVARAIMTTDLYPKIRRAELQCGDNEDEIGVICATSKGAGMIEPNMATMLAFILTDVDIEQESLQTMLHEAMPSSFNAITVDTDTSTSDTVAIVSSGRKPLSSDRETRKRQLANFQSALTEVCRDLACDIVRNAEGATHLIRIEVTGAPSDNAAAKLGKAVLSSRLLATAIAGNDPNVGRLLAAVGKHLGHSTEGAWNDFNAEKLILSMGGRELFRDGKFKLDEEAELYLQVRAFLMALLYCEHFID